MSNEMITDQETVRIVQEIVEKSGTDRSELIPILKTIMAKIGYISPVAIVELSSQMNLPSNEIVSVATFYRMLATQPRGKHVVQFCESAPCHVVGGRQVWNTLESALGLKPGETSQDKQWTLLTTSCLGVCGIGPVVMIDTDIYGDVRPEQVKSILSRYE
ncbi:MAG: NADH-quinone oxidoreductase subunit NuoE [Anaerolineaceae bacterium]